MAEEPEPETPQKRVYVGLPKRWDEMTPEEQEAFAQTAYEKIRDGLGLPNESREA
jgi:hypothetical protein